MNVTRNVCVGLLYGGLFYGGVLSLAHLQLNQIQSIGQALSVGFAFLIIYGAWCAACSLGCVLLGRLWRRKSRKAGDPGLLPDGFVLFHLTFWLPYALYGLTYDQTLLVRPQNIWQMSAYLAVCAVGLSVGCVLLGLLVARVFAQRSGGKVMIAAVVVMLLLHLSAPWTFAGNHGSGARTTLDDVELSERPEGPPVLLLGFDGLDPWLMDELVENGDLPNYERLRRRGVSGALETTPDANSAVTWASAYSGLTPHVHGIHDFFKVRLPLVGELYGVHRTFFNEITGLAASVGFAQRLPIDRRSLSDVPLLWEITDFFGLETGVIDGYLYSFPAMVPQTPGSFFLSYGLDSFALALESEKAEVAELPLFVQPIDLFAADELPTEPDFEWQTRVLLDRLAEGRQERFLSLYTHQPDAIMHQRWPELEPEKFFTSPEDLDEGQTIVDLHREFDRFLGQLDEHLDPATAVILVSDHGHSATPVHRLYSQHRHGPPGVVLMWGGPFREGLTLEGAHVYDVFPTVLYLLGLPLPEDGAGRLLDEAIASDFLDEYPVSGIASYRGLWKPRIQDGERGRELNELEIEKLRAMGYVAALDPSGLDVPRSHWSRR